MDLLNGNALSKDIIVLAKAVAMHVVKCLLILSLMLESSFGLKSEARIILDVIRFYDKPTAVVAKVCWGVSDKISFATEILKTANAITIQYTDNLKTIERYSPKDMLIILDLNCEDSGEFLEKANRTNKFSKPYRWLLLYNTEDSVDVVPSDLKNLLILVDSEVIVAYKANDETILRRVYRIDYKRDFISEKFAMWTLDNGLILSNEAKVSTPVRRKNLGRKRIGISIVSLDDSTKTEIYNLKNLEIDDLSKCTFHNILPLYTYMNATIELLFTDTWGYYINNTWNGMIGDLTRGDADLCGTATFLTLDRLRVLSFTTQPVPVAARFVFRQPPLSLQNNLFYLPFRPAVWMCVGALIITVFLVIYLCAMWEAEKNGQRVKDPTVLQPHLSDVAILVVGAVIQQGSSHELKGGLGRVVIFITFLIFLFLYSSYAANIVALLQSSSDQIKTLSDLLNSKLELGVEDQPYNRYFFTTTTDRVRKEIYESKVARTGHKPNFMSTEEGVKKLRNIDAPFAFHVNTGLAYKFVEQLFYEHEKCGLREIEYIQNAKPWVSCRKHSPYTEIYKIGLARIMEHGIGDRINRFMYARKPSCITGGGTFGSVNMMDFHPVLLCLLYGIIAAVMVLGLEILVYKLQMRIKSGSDETRDISIG